MRRDALKSRRRTLAAFACAVALAAIQHFVATPASAQQRTTLKRVEKTLASLPFDSGAARSVVVSPDGTRGAYVRPLKAGTKDGPFVVVIDGNISEQPYDQVGRNVVTFSPDSRRTAFAGRRGGQWYVEVDGSEGIAFDAVSPDSILFSPDGRRVAFVAERDGKAMVVTDGVPSNTYDAIIEGSLSFDVGAARLVYVARAGGKDPQEFIVLNGVEGKAYDTVGRPRFSHDGQHLAYAASARRRSFVVLDGIEGKAYAGEEAVHPLSLTFGSDGSRLAYVVGPAGEMVAVIDGVEGKLYEQVYDNSITFSPDGRRVGYVAKRFGIGNDATRPAAVVVLDDKEGRPHAGVVPGSIRFSGDGRRVAYLAERSGPDGAVRRCAVVDGVEGKAYDWVREAPVFSPDGRHYAYVAQRRAAPAARPANDPQSPQQAAPQQLAPQQPAPQQPPNRLPPGQYERTRLPPRRVADAQPAARPGDPRPDAVFAAAQANVPPPAPRDIASFESFAVVDGTEAGPYPWVRGDLRFTPDGGRLAYLAAAPDPRFADAGDIPTDPAIPAAGGRLVFERSSEQPTAPALINRPVKMLIVEEQLAAE